MKNIYLAALHLFPLLTLNDMLSAQAPVINAVTPAASTVEQWGKFEVALDVAANWTNPYDYDEIRVSGIFTDPAGQNREAEGFFMQDYTLDNQTGALTPNGNGRFRLRFSPDQTGTWKYRISCTNAAGTGTFPEQAFAVTAAGSPNKGFIRGDQTNYLHFDNGEQFIPVGENIAWQESNVYPDYKNWLTRLSDNGGNFFRLWQCHWGLGLEWKSGAAGYQGLRKFHQGNAFYMDWLLDFCTERGIYVLYCLQHHGQVSSQVNPNWDESPYNAANGGPCANTWDFFSGTAAKNHVKNRYRYVLARWGYSRSILAWELFNEVDWTDQFALVKSSVSDWHLEMAAFLKDHDPGRHLVSTSYAQDFHDPATWNQPDIDFTQTHYYVNTPNLERVLATGIRDYLNAYEKPSLTAEFGLTTAGNGLAAIDPDGIHVHNSLWGSLFGGGLGAGMSWWWDSYIGPQDLYHHFGPVAAVAQQVPFRNSNLSPAPSAVSGAPGDLTLTPILTGWGALADTSFTIDQNGMVTPPGAGLAAFLYGSQWNTQYRRPPIFHVHFPQGGQFRVKTGSDAGQSPRIAIWLDGVKVLDQNAAVNQSYSVAVPAGHHTIVVDNTGTDWILISGYTFSGIGSAVDAYVLKAAGQNKVAGWTLNNRYNHDYLAANGQPPLASGATISVAGVQNGTYTARFFDCLTGSNLLSTPVTVANGNLSLTLPDLLWDLAFLVEEQASAIAEPKPALDFQIYPNPAPAGGTVTLRRQAPENERLSVTLLDAEGRLFQTLFTGDAGGSQQITLPAHLPAGTYWVKTEDSTGRAGVRGIVIGR